MKSLLASILVLALAACSNLGGKPQDVTESNPKQVGTAPKLAESDFQESGGALNLVFDAQGNWVKITSKGTADLASDTPSGRETAMMIATMRAKRTVAEFMNNDIRSTKALTRIARSYNQTFQSSESPRPDESMGLGDNESVIPLADSEDSRQALRLASTLTERIQDNSSAILKGVYVSNRSVEEGRVIVEVTASRESVEAARQASRMMRGAMQ